MNIYDFVSFLQEGLILVGGNSMTEVSISLNTLAAKQQSIVGIPKGNLNQLQELVDAVSQGNVSLTLVLCCLRGGRVA